MSATAGQGLAGGLRRAAIAGLLMLLALSALTLWLAFPGRGAVPVVLALLLALPLALPLPGLLRGKRRTGVWSVFLLAPYLALGLTEVIANPAARSSATALIFTVLVTAILLIGWLRVARLQSGR